MPTSTLSLRPFTVADALVVGPWLDGKGVSLPPGGVATRWAERLCADPRVRAWMAVQQGTPVAFVRLDIGPDRVAELTIAVAAGHRRAGLGSRALALVLDEARRLQIRRLQAIVDVGNAAAVAFFAKAGFEEAAVGAAAWTFVRYLHDAAAPALEIEG